MLHGGVIDSVIAIWFAISVLVEIGSTVTLWVWLRRRGMKPDFFFTGIPGYLESFYVEWCQSHGRRYSVLIDFRTCWLINTILAGISFGVKMAGG